MKYDHLKDRTKKFTIDMFRLCEELSKIHTYRSITNQLVRCSGSVGANYRAACRAKSKADLINKLKIVEEELDESMFFLEVLLELDEAGKVVYEKQINEANELLSIIVSSIKTLKQ